MKKLLFILLLASPCLASGPKYNFKDPRLNDELANIYKDGSFPNISIGRASTMTVTQLNVSSITATGSVTTGNLIASSGTIKSFMVVGTGTNDSAPTGRMGEKIESVVGATNFPSTGVMGDLTSISLTPGDWNVSALLAASRNGATITEVSAGISVNSGTSGVGLVDGNTNAHTTGPTATNRTFIVIPDVAMSVSVATTVYLKYTADFTVATPQAAGRLTARRPR